MEDTQRLTYKHQEQKPSRCVKKITSFNTYKLLHTSSLNNIIVIHDWFNNLLFSIGFSTSPIPLHPHITHNCIQTQHNFQLTPYAWKGSLLDPPTTFIQEKRCIQITQAPSNEQSPDLFDKNTMGLKDY